MRSAGSVLMGIVCILMSVVAWVGISSFPWHLFPVGARWSAYLFPLIPVVIGVSLLFGVRLPGMPMDEQKGDEAVVVQERVIVKIRCRYCGGLYDETLDKCPNCGATR